MHRDDSVFVGPEAELHWAQKRMEQSFLIKVIGRLGGDQDLKDLQALNRVIRWDKFGIQMEADSRHQEILPARELISRAVSTPRVKERSPAGTAA